MNSGFVLTEEKPLTSSVELDNIQPYRIPHVPMWYFQDLGMTSITWLTPKQTSYFYFATAAGIDMSGLYPKIVVSAPTTQVSFQNRSSIETLLGYKGERLLEKLIVLIEGMSLKQDWPLIRIEVRHMKDVEVRDWRYILLILVFDSDFDSADKYLHNLYERLDLLTDTLGQEEQDIFRRMIFFDVATAIWSIQPQDIS